MKIALINENSQAGKNAMICETLKKVVEPMGHEVFNYGMYSAEDTHQLTYVQNGILAAVLLNSGAADFVITGCGTGEGAMLACNAFPKVLCGHIASPLDAYLFSQVNDGNCVALPFAENFGWGGELNLGYIFEKLFCAPGGQDSDLKSYLMMLVEDFKTDINNSLKEIQENTDKQKTLKRKHKNPLKYCKKIGPIR